MYDEKEGFDLDEVMNLQPHNMKGFCDNRLNANALLHEIENGYGPFHSRKSLCDYLGIGESTFTGWLKEDRIPVAAKEAYVLAQAITLLQEEIKKLRNGFKIVKCNDSYQLCLFKEDEEGTVIGTVLVDGIKNIKIARLLAFSFPAFSLLSESADVIEEMLDRTENPTYIAQLESLKERIIQEKSYANNYDFWRESYGKKGRAESLERLLKEIGPVDISPLIEEQKIWTRYAITIKSKKYGAKTVPEVIVVTLKLLSETHPDLLKKLADAQGGRVRPNLTRKKEAVYPGRPDLLISHPPIEINGYWVGTNYGQSDAKRILQKACEIVGLQYGRDVSFSLNSTDVNKITLEDLDLICHSPT